MNTAIATSVALSILRHLLVLAGAAVFVEKHDSELANLAGLIVAAGAALYGAWNARQQQRAKLELSEAVEQARSETQILMKTQANAAGSQTP